MNERLFHSFISDLSRFSSPGEVLMRAQDAFGVAIKLFTLIDNTVPDPENNHKIKMAWFKAVRDNDFRKFNKAYKKYSTLGKDNIS